MTDPFEIQEVLGHTVDLIIDGGHCGMEPTSVIIMEDPPTVARRGKGDTSLFEG
jgi:tRNA A37 threonylcarbamoyladenosine synthetase subunit TsaC/SUA5/YrdC